MIGVLGAARVTRRLQGRRDLLFAVAVALSLWLTPHAMVYDLVLLLIPALLLWREFSNTRSPWVPLYALVWIATLVTAPLTLAQLQWLPAAVQVVVPVLTYVYVRACYTLLSG